MKKTILFLSAIILLISCKDDYAPEPSLATPVITITSPASGFSVDIMQWLRINPQISSIDEVTSSWWLNDEKIGDTQNLLHVFATPGSYNLTLKTSNSIGESSKTVTVTVNDATYTPSSRNGQFNNYITRVFDFLPAPGQFVNKMPEATTDDTPRTMRKKTEEILTSGGMISLGGFGGYVVFGFDHVVVNQKGNNFIVLGNAFTNGAEPGVIMVAVDTNGTGFPDDDTEWFEIAGSEFHKPTTIRDYEITYYRPESEPATRPYTNYIRWTDNQGDEGWISKNQFHSQAYFPLWAGDKLTLSGTFMEATIFQNGTIWQSPAVAFGYADNWANNDPRGHIDLDWAVDADGNPVKLKGIDFVRVYTGNRAEGGLLGEISTEVAGFTNLNF
ncbi:MAG: PKD domain-containing protein [Dysgonamonadaceae bacterium]|jgi:PKD repeat protein|nr:PKD domain-containing protein [Dysgonamonadaceae bacterium]